MVVESSDTRFPQDVAQQEMTVVDFWAPWCGPCRAFAPIFEASAERRPEVSHLKVNVDENPRLSEYFGVTSIPTTVVIRDGVVLGSTPGALNGTQLDRLLDEAAALDMDVVRQQAQRG